VSDITFGDYDLTYYEYDLPYEDLDGSIHVVGSPDMGKSTLLGNLAEQFHAAGEGVLVVDITGNLVREIAARTSRPKETIYVKLGAVDFGLDSSGKSDIRSWTFNPFEGHRESEIRREQISRGVRSSFQLMGRADLSVMANINETLSDALGVAIAMTKPTFLDLYGIVTDKGFRDDILKQFLHINPVVVRHWMEIDNFGGRLDKRESMEARERRSYMNTTRNRLSLLLNDRAIQRAVGQYAGTIKLREWLDAGKLVLLDLGTPLERETGIDIGNLLLAQVIIETFRREGGYGNQRWRLVIDEFHEFASEQIALLITNGRQFNVFPIVANQDRGQFTRDRHGPRLLSAVGHATVNLILRSSVEDRVGLASIYGQDFLEHIYGLSHYQAIVDTHLDLLDNREKPKIWLKDWWGHVVPGQLEELMWNAHTDTIPIADLDASNQERYGKYLVKPGNRDTRNTDAHDKPKQSGGNGKGPASTTQQSQSDKRAKSGPTPASAKNAAGAGGTGPARSTYQRHDPGPPGPSPRRRSEGDGRGDSAGKPDPAGSL
jgi:hypothetical protein